MRGVFVRGFLERRRRGCSSSESVPELVALYLSRSGIWRLGEFFFDVGFDGLN